MAGAMAIGVGFGAGTGLTTGFSAGFATRAGTIGWACIAGSTETTGTGFSGS